MSAEAVAARVRRASELADLHSARWLYAKIGMTGPEVAARVRQAFELWRLCVALAEAGKKARARGT